jgi:hypothetical protein
VSVFGKIPPDFTGRAWQDGQFHELWFIDWLIVI